MRPVPRTDLSVFDLCLGGNVFGWTADEPNSFAVLDRYLAAGGNMVDTAEMYGNGHSEEVIGRWLADRGVRDQIVVATKASPGTKEHPLAAQEIIEAAERSLRRLQVDRIDLYFAHYDDPTTALAETLEAFDRLVREGKVAQVATSNYSASRLVEALQTSADLGLRGYVAIQPHYNLMERSVYEDELRGVVGERGLGCFPYFALAKGFLTGKYAPGQTIDSPRAKGASAYVGERGDRVLTALREVADAHAVGAGAVALRWLADRPTVTAPIASARSVAQLEELLPMARIELSESERDRLDVASR